MTPRRWTILGWTVCSTGFAAIALIKGQADWRAAQAALLLSTMIGLVAWKSNGLAFVAGATPCVSACAAASPWLPVTAPLALIAGVAGGLLALLFRGGAR